MRVYERLKPSKVVILGDWLDAHSWSSHPATPGETSAHYYDDEIEPCRLILDRFDCDIVYLEGNHEERVRRHILKHGGPWQDVQDQVLPEKLLARPNLTWVPYGQTYEIASDLVACHGFSTAKAAADKHLDLVPGYSVVFGHTHRQQHVVRRNPVTGKLLHGFCPGTLSELQPVWAKSPTTWSHGFSLIYFGKSGNWTPYNVPINNSKCVLPCGTTVNGSDPF